jgi:hypothetical protein
MLVLGRQEQDFCKRDDDDSIIFLNDDPLLCIVIIKVEHTRKDNPFTDQHFAHCEHNVFLARYSNI